MRCEIVAMHPMVLMIIMIMRMKMIMISSIIQILMIKSMTMAPNIIIIVRAPAATKSRYVQMNSDEPTG